uniref:Tf2-1-like SH3-like domain-containing protein n=1 Tax=Ananas comosus var. bracteatus TaxID=296719 RepID=A0A6V7PS12_ANACO|nr:unnamed protein product [Ananas comosus var. bracteatus]
MLRACVIDFLGGWSQHLLMAKFAYNNSYQASIKMAPFEALYGRKRRSPLHWSEVGKRLALGPDVLQEAEDKVSPTRGIKRFGIRGKLSPRFIGPYEILERVGPVVYRLALPPNLSGVHNVFHVSVLRKYIFDPTHVLDATPVELRDDFSFEEQPVRVLAREMRKLRNRDIPYVRVLWSNHGEQEATWELESALRERYPHLFQMES